MKDGELEEKEKEDKKQNGRISKEDATHWFFQGLNADSTSDFEDFWSEWSGTGGDEYGPSVLSDSKEEVENISDMEMKVLELLEDIYPKGAYPEEIAEDTGMNLTKTKTAITWLEDMSKVETIRIWTEPHVGDKFVILNRYYQWVKDSEKDDKTERVRVYRDTRRWGDGLVFLPADIENIDPDKLGYDAEGVLSGLIKKGETDWKYLGTYDVPRELLEKIKYGIGYRE